VSGIGKGITSASMSLLVKARGLSVLPIKMDPYLNIDAGTMNPFQHGEVFVTADGAETDLDLGHYERFLDQQLDRDSNFTSGAVYNSVIRQERHGDFLGEDIQIIPHVTDEIISRVEGAARRKRADVSFVEIGGTVGDIEGEPFLEAARQIARRAGPGNTLFVHVVKMDYLFPSDEAKTKPIQQSVALLRERGIQPDFLIVRAKRPLTREQRDKISLFTNVHSAAVIPSLDARSTYEVPLMFEENKLGDALLARLGITPNTRPHLAGWRSRVRSAMHPTASISVVLVGKYVEQVDAYLSVEEALRHAGALCKVHVAITHADAEQPDLKSVLRSADAIIVPGGFGKRGIGGKIAAARYAREHGVPYLGLCLGMQIAVIEFARSVCGKPRANSTEFDAKSPDPVIDILPEQKKMTEKGATMRLGAQPIVLQKDSLAARLYGKTRIAERHRHRFEINPKYHKLLTARGMRLSGFMATDRRLVEFIELPEHPFFIATQAHPEFTSRFLRPHPLFLGLVKAGARFHVKK
jgi:CTP synthase